MPSIRPKHPLRLPPLLPLALPLLLLLTLPSIVPLTGCAPMAVMGTAMGARVVHDRRSPQTLLDDEIIETRAMVLFFQHQDIARRSRIRASSFNHRVLLTGQADDPAVARRFAELISALPNVREVYNEVEIGPRIGLTQQATDAGISARANIAIGGGRGLEDFDMTRVKIITENGVVFLMGLVSPEEGDLTADVVRRLPGVQRVVKVFEYIDPAPHWGPHEGDRMRGTA